MFKDPKFNGSLVNKLSTAPTTTRSWPAIFIPTTSRSTKTTPTPPTTTRSTSAKAILSTTSKEVKNFCQEDSCLNEGVCESQSSNFKCICPKSFTGKNLYLNFFV